MLYIFIKKVDLTQGDVSRVLKLWSRSGWTNNGTMLLGAKRVKAKKSPKHVIQSSGVERALCRRKKTAASEGSNTLRDELSEHWKWTGQWAGSGQKCKKEKLTVTWQLLRSCGKGPILTPKKLGAENSKLGMNQWSLFHCFCCLWSVYTIQWLTDIQLFDL